MDTDTALSRFVTDNECDAEGRIYLTDEDATIETPPGLKIELFPHQKTVLKAMLDAEKNRRRIRNWNLWRMTSESQVLESNAIVLSEPYGTGKTFIIIAFILYCRLPKAYPEVDNSIMMTHRNYYSRGDNNVWPCATEIIRKFRRINLPTLIVCGRSVLVQWRETLQEYTNLKFFEIGNYYHLCTFYDMYKKKEHQMYDIILVKNDKVTGSFRLDNETEIDRTAERSIVTVLSKMSMNDGACWANVVYDDFDVISIPANALHIHGLFTIYVSATHKNSYAKAAPNNVRYNTIEECIEAYQMKISNAFDDVHLFTTYNVKNITEYTESSIRIPIFKSFRYVYKNPDDKYIGLIDALEHDTKNIAEMLNGDAIQTAAETLGINAKTPIDIFQKMLADKYAEFMKYSKIVDVMQSALEYVKGLPMGDKELSRDTIEKSMNRLRKGKPIGDKIDIRSDELINKIKYEIQENIEQKNKLGRAVDRVKENLAGGECQVCLLPLEGLEIFIIKCCGMILCGVCGIKSTNMRASQNMRTGIKEIAGSCPQCRRPLNITTDVVFVNGGFDADAIAKARGDEVDSIVPAPKAAPLPKELEPEIKNPKMRALLAIIQGKKPENQEEYKSNIKHLVTGRVDLPQTQGMLKKVLVFANYDETLDNIKAFLDEQKVKYLHLHGTYQMMAKIVNEFKQSGTVLLINSTHHCAGLNLQFATDMVFFHRMVDDNIEGQVAGRGQRIGRTCNLHIHSLLYTNEAHYLI